MSEYQKTSNETLFTTDSWRVFRIISEFVDGFETLTELGPSVTIFGSARTQPGTEFYNLAIDVAEKITDKGFSIITGGGPGIMEAANRGAKARNGKSCGVGIDVPMEKDMNKYVDPDYRLKFRYFFIRKVMFIRYAQACIFLPGGFGTLDELFEVLTLIQTKKINPFPIYLMGKKYWEGLDQWIKDTQVKQGNVSKEDLNLYKITDDAEEVALGIEKHYQSDQTIPNF